MKICFAINNLQAGGAERVFSALVNWFVQNTPHTIFVLKFSYLRDKPDFYRLDDRINVVFSFFENSDAATSVLFKIQPDCIVSFLNPMNYIVSQAAQRVGIPHIVCERNNPYFSPPKEKDREHRDKAFFNAAGCVFQTQNAASYFDKFDLKGQIIIIENPVCVSTKCGKKKENRIIAVGRYAEQKNYPVLLRAFHEFRLLHPRYKLDCYGKDSGKLTEIKDIAYSNKWDEGVSFHSPIESIYEEIESAKLFLMTSLYEGMPNALAEAAALGLPCVAVDVPGVRDLINKYHCGILCPKHDPEMIASIMDDLLQNEELCTSLSANGEKIIETVGIDKIAPKWEAFINNIVTNTTPHAIQ